MLNILNLRIILFLRIYKSNILYLNILNKTVRQRAVDTADALGIGDMLKRYPEDLSKGEKQRVAICRAILSKPKLILADEPTGNLDSDNKTKILDLLFHSVEEHKATLLAVTHDYELLKRFDRVIDFKDFETSYNELQ